MFPASTKQAGMCTTTGPTDVCKVPAPPAPPIPTPFPNIAQCSQATGTTTKTKVSGKAVIVQSSKIPRSNGDEVGTLFGMVSNRNMCQAKWAKCSGKVSFENKKVAYHTAMTKQNGSNANTPGIHSVPSQAKLLIGM